MKGAPVAHGPGNKGKQGSERARAGERESAAGKTVSEAVHDHASKQSNAEQRAIRAKQSGRDGGKHRKRKRASADALLGAARLPKPKRLRKREQPDRDRQKLECFRKRRSGVAGGKGAQRRQPKRREPGAASDRHRREPSCQQGEQQTPCEVERYLQVEDGVILVDAENTKAGSQKQRVAGQADQGRGARVKAVHTVLEQVAGDGTVEQRIARQIGVAQDKKQAKRQAQQQRKNIRERSPPIVI